MNHITSNLKSKNWIELESLSRQYIKIKPTDPKGYELLGISLGSLNKINESIIALEKAYKFDPRDPSICKNLAISYCKINDINKLLNLIQNSQKHSQSLKIKIIDLETVFDLITKNDGDSLKAQRRLGVNFPKLGPYPTIVSGPLRDDSVFESGFVIFEIFVSSDGHILKSNKLAGQKPLLTDAERYLNEIKFQPLSLDEISVIQKCKLVFRYDRDSYENNDPKMNKIKRMGIGFSTMEAEKNAYQVSSPPDFPGHRGHSVKTMP